MGSEAYRYGSQVPTFIHEGHNSVAQYHSYYQHSITNGLRDDPDILERGDGYSMKSAVMVVIKDMPELTASLEFPCGRLC